MNRLTRQITRIRIKQKPKYLLLLLVLCIGCKGPKVVSEGPNQSEDKPLTLLMRDLYGGSEQEELRVIRNPKALAGYFAKINMARKPGLPVPEIDFEKEVALLYSPGRRQDTLVPELYYVGMAAGKYTLGVKPAKPVNELHTGGPVVTPFLLYTIPAEGGEIGLEDRPGVLKPE